MKLNNIGYNHFHDTDLLVDRPEGSGDTLFLLLKSTGVFHMKEGIKIGQPNSFLLYEEGYPQYYTAYESTFDNDWFHFSVSEEEVNWLKELNIPFNQLVHLENIHEFSMLINQMCTVNLSASTHTEELLDHYLRIFFLRLSDHLHTTRTALASSVPSHSKLATIHTKIHTTPYLDWNIGWMAHELTMSRSSFNVLYKEAYGITAMADVIQSRIEYSKYYLKTSSISIKQVAFLCGYKNETHFMRQFKQVTGITPSEFRSRQTIETFSSH